jgi:hypothetical protein
MFTIGKEKGRKFQMKNQDSVSQGLKLPEKKVNFIEQTDFLELENELGWLNKMGAFNRSTSTGKRQNLFRRIEYL